MPYKIEGTVAKVHGEEWLIVAELSGNFCLAVKNGSSMPAPVYMIYAWEVIANLKASEVIVDSRN